MGDTRAGAESDPGAAGWSRPRRRLRGLDATTTLVDFALVTFDVTPAALAAVLPVGLRPDTRVLDDGRTRGFVSAVSFRDVDFRFAIAPVVRVSFFQTNYRAYVIGPAGEHAVQFFETTLDSPLAALPRRLWGMPWHRGRTSIEASWTGAACRSYRHRCASDRARADVALTGTDVPMGRLDGFRDLDDAALFLTHPLDGFFVRPDGRLGRYSVWHPRLRPTVGVAQHARYDVFERLGLVSRDATPHSVLLQRRVDFDVLLPPTGA
ncbi:MAG: hypothetical protein QOF49_681 [Chloroflexota bacterium]|nr:hypothetical protein [Chloroflexota bacterium]